MNEYNDLINLSLSAHRDYVVSRMDNNKTNILYYDEMFEVISALAICGFYGQIEDLGMVFNQMRETPLSLNRELKYKKLALSHANEIIQGIIHRFEGKVHAQN